MVSKGKKQTEILLDINVITEVARIRLKTLNYFRYPGS